MAVSGRVNRLASTRRQPRLAQASDVSKRNGARAKIAGLAIATFALLGPLSSRRQLSCRSWVVFLARGSKGDHAIAPTGLANARRGVVGSISRTASAEGNTELGQKAASLERIVNAPSAFLLPPAEETPQIASFLQKAVKVWLDSEWEIELEAHEAIAVRTAAIYSDGRLADGDARLTSVQDLLMAFGTRLSTEEPAAFGEAFEGPWDVANKACDFVTAYMRRNLTGCALDAATEEALRVSLPGRAAGGWGGGVCD